jgi:hypothetical protein
MNGARYNYYQTNRMNRLMKLPLLCGCLMLLSMSMAWATIPLYTNTSSVFYTEANPPPNIDATAFANDAGAVFSIDFGTFNASTEFYQTLNTINYTNYGQMFTDTAFKFDLQTDGVIPDQIAGTFYNPGSITCGSSDVILDGDLLIFGGAGQFIAWATNIINPGPVDVGGDGLIQFSGQNVDLSRSVLTIESPEIFEVIGSTITNINVSGTANPIGLVGAIGIDTNGDWNPAIDLNAGTAFSSEPFILNLFNSTSYFNVANTGPSNTIIRAVFVENTGTNVPYSVYFDTAGSGLGGGSATVAWTGSYVNPATGLWSTNYLYLNNDYALGASTNAAVIGGIPNNFTFTGSLTPLIVGQAPAPAGFIPNIFFSGVVTNPYSYLSAQFIATTVATNTLLHTNVSALPGRIVVTGSNELNMALANISGANYLSVTSSNQFDGSSGAQIAAAYADFSLGRTNGTLTVSNLLEAQIPVWSGTVQAWSTRWLEVDTNTGITNDFRVVLVNSQLIPFTQPLVQNLTLNATNSLVISDTLNVFGAVSANAQNLTVTTNGNGNGATSLQGELNISSPTFSWSASLPDLLNLTNNGVINLSTFAQFIGTTNNITVIPTTPQATATGRLSKKAGTNVRANDTVTLGTNQYIFVSKLTNTVANQVLIGTTFAGSLTNLFAAIDQAGGSGTTYSSATIQNPLALANSVATNAITVLAVLPGSTGNSIVSTTTSTNLTWTNGITLTGGVNGVTGSTNSTPASVPYDNFINNSLLLDQGATIWVDNFVNDGYILNNGGSFAVQAFTVTLTNGLINAEGNVSFTADSLEASNVVLDAGGSLTLQVTNLLTDDVPNGAGPVTNGNVWVVGSSSSAGLNLPIVPVSGGLLGTTITNIAQLNRNVINTWAGHDFGDSAAGYTNNAAIGRLILDASANGVFTFNGASTLPGVTNGLYVDYLELRDQATNLDTHGNPIALTNSPNLVIYYAQAVMEGVSVAETLNHENNNHLRWVPAYAGHYSSTNIFYAGTTNTINAALAGSQDIDSTGDGTVNANNPEPIFVPSQVNFGVVLTNVPPLSAKLQWTTIPNATNIIQYTTNLLSPSWQIFTNFNAYYYSANLVVPVATTNGFISPQTVPGPSTNVWVFDALTNSTQRYYRVLVSPNVANLYGP